jgi:hypothetical protein
MNRLAVLLIVLSSILTVTTAVAQIHTGNLTLTSQAEVNAFDYSEVTGTLSISGADIVDLSPLSPLTSVGKYISISNNTALVVAEGFENVTDVGWGISVYNNTNMVSFSGFDALEQTGDNIDFWYNDSLVSVSGFGSLHTAGWSLEFGGNPVLTSIPDFESLQLISSSLFILDNAALTRISSFKSLQYVDYSFDIVGNASLASLCGFHDYLSANESYTGGGSFNISDNHPSLPSPATRQDILDAGRCGVALLDSLILDIQAMELSPGTSNRLLRELGKTKNFVESGRDGDAVGKLASLIDDIVSLESRGKIDGATADYLVMAILDVIDAIGS